jgi:phosphoglycerate dehydrogenase-like enzyme
VLVIMRERTPFPADLIAQLPNLKLLVTTSGRNRAVDLEACSQHNVLVCHTEFGTIPTAELTWALILGLAKNIPIEDRGTREGRWGIKAGIGLSGKTLGVVGLGRLGKRVAQIGALFEMDVIAWSPNLTDVRAKEAGCVSAWGQQRDRCPKLTLVRATQPSDIMQISIVSAGSEFDAEWGQFTVPIHRFQNEAHHKIEFATS